MIRRAIGLAAALACTQAGAMSYQLIDLGSLNGGSGTALALNNLGQVVGGSVVSGRTQAFVWAPDTGMLNLHGGIYPLSGSEATGINERGQISVDYGNLSKVYTPGSGFANVGAPTGAVVTAGINASGTVVGSLGFQSFVARAGRPAELREIGSYGLALNDAGVVAGALSRGGSVTRPTLWSATGVARDLGDLDPSVGGGAALALNSRGDVAGSSFVYTPGGGVARAFLWQAGTGMVALGNLYRGSEARGINDAGQVVGFGFDASYSAPLGAFLWSAPTGMLDVNTLLEPGTAARLLQANAINALGQIAGLADTGRPALLTPSGDLAWQGGASSSFNDGRNWELGFAPNRLLDAKLYTAGAQTLAMAADATVNSLALGAANGGRPLLMLQDGARLTATYGVTVGVTGSLSGNGSVAGAVRNLGTITAAQLRLDGGLINRGLVNGSGRLDTDLLNDSEGQLRLSAGEAMVLSGSAHTNRGRIELRGGELEVNGTLTHEAGARLLLERGATGRFNDGLHTAGRIDVGFGGAEVFGAVEQLAGAQTVVSGTSSVTFHDAVTVGAGAELRVSAGSTALFFGAVNERSGALLTGTGTKFFEGGLSVGDSPGVVVDAGSVSLGTGNVYLAELGGVATGSEFDHLAVGGELHFGGTLKLVSWAGFKPSAGQRFDLFDWGSQSGQFAQIDASDLLGPGLALDTSRLYLDGSIGVSAVPEPHQALLLAAGLLAIAGKRRLLPQR